MQTDYEGVQYTQFTKINEVIEREMTEFLADHDVSHEKNKVDAFLAYLHKEKDSLYLILKKWSVNIWPKPSFDSSVGLAFLFFSVAFLILISINSSSSKFSSSGVPANSRESQLSLINFVVSYITKLSCDQGFDTELLRRHEPIQ